MTSETIRKRIAALEPWYHNIDLGNGSWTKGVGGGRPRAGNCEAIEAAIPADLTGKRVLDLGCNAGYFSFVCAERGGDVLGIDRNQQYIKQARFCAGVKVSPASFRVADVYDIAQYGTFDLVLCLGLMYHVRDVRLAFQAVRAVCTGVLILETVAYMDQWANEHPLILASGRMKERSGSSQLNRMAIENLLKDARFTGIRPVFEEKHRNRPGQARVCYTARKVTV